MELVDWSPKWCPDLDDGLQDWRSRKRIKQSINFCTKTIDLIKFLPQTQEWKINFSRVDGIRNESIVVRSRSVTSYCSRPFIIKIVIVGGKNETIKTNKHRNAVNRAHKSQFSINSISMIAVLLHILELKLSAAAAADVSAGNKFSEFIGSNTADSASFRFWNRFSARKWLFHN